MSRFIIATCLIIVTTCFSTTSFAQSHPDHAATNPTPDIIPFSKITVSLDFDKAPLQKVLNHLAIASKRNFDVYDENPHKNKFAQIPITLHLQDKPILVALAEISKASQLDFLIDDSSVTFYDSDYSIYHYQMLGPILMTCEADVDYDFSTNPRTEDYRVGFSIYLYADPFDVSQASIRIRLKDADKSVELKQYANQELYFDRGSFEIEEPYPVGFNPIFTTIDCKLTSLESYQVNHVVFPLKPNITINQPPATFTTSSTAFLPHDTYFKAPFLLACQLKLDPKHRIPSQKSSPTLPTKPELQPHLNVVSCYNDNFYSDSEDYFLSVINASPDNFEMNAYKIHKLAIDKSTCLYYTISSFKKHHFTIEPQPTAKITVIK